MSEQRIEDLSIGGERTLEHIDHDALERFRFPDGHGFPPSYAAFVRHLGWARLFGLWLIYPPVLPGHADGLLGRGRALTSRFAEEYREGEAEGFDWIVEPDGDWQRARSLQVFGWSENGDVLLWDTSARDGAGEFPIWESARMQSLHRRGSTLAEVLPGLRARAGSLSMDHDAQPLTSSLL